jgi:hypothetical protein
MQIANTKTAASPLEYRGSFHDAHLAHPSNAALRHYQKLTELLCPLQREPSQSASGSLHPIRASQATSSSVRPEGGGIEERHLHEPDTA